MIVEVLIELVVTVFAEVVGFVFHAALTLTRKILYGLDRRRRLAGSRSQRQLPTKLTSGTEGFMTALQALREVAFEGVSRLEHVLSTGDWTGSDCDYEQRGALERLEEQWESLGSSGQADLLEAGFSYTTIVERARGGAMPPVSRADLRQARVERIRLIRAIDLSLRRFRRRQKRGYRQLALPDVSESSG